jgi:hypothetical protein
MSADPQPDLVGHPAQPLAQNSPIGAPRLKIAGESRAALTAARRAFYLASPVTQRDAVDRRSPMSAADSVRRARPGENSRAQVPVDGASNVRPLVAISCLT